MNIKTQRKNATCSGFTLYEIMAVIAIMSILAGLTTNSIKGLVSSSNLNQAVELVTRSAVMARQMAMSDGRAVALIVADPVTGTTDQAVMLLKATPSTTGINSWEVAGPWEQIPQGVAAGVFDRGSLPSFYKDDTDLAPLQGVSLTQKLNGSLVSKYSYIIFLPDGTVNAPVTAENAPSLTIKRLNKNNTANDYIILVQGNTGRSKVIEP